MSEQEEWRSVEGYEGLYEVSSLGRVRSIERIILGLFDVPHRYKSRVLSPRRNGDGHVKVALYRDRVRTNVHVHSIVLSAFVGHRPPGADARHLNGIPSDNRLANLEWGSRSQNMLDKKWHAGQRNWKLNPLDVAEIKQSLSEPYLGINRDLAAKFSVHPSTISDIKRSRRHRDVGIQGDRNV
jgi:hypothetical protein